MKVFWPKNILDISGCTLNILIQNLKVLVNAINDN